VSDGYNDSAPATITFKVTETKPPAKSGFEWALLLGAAVGIAAVLRRRRA
jgi:MYXO-CTERM domain-containing protein